MNKNSKDGEKLEKGIYSGVFEWAKLGIRGLLFQKDEVASLVFLGNEEFSALPKKKGRKNCRPSLFVTSAGASLAKV